MRFFICLFLWLPIVAFGDAGLLRPSTPSPITAFHVVSATDSQGTPLTEEEMARRISVGAKVIPTVTRGARPVTEIDFAYLASIGVKVIINLQGGDFSENGAFGRYFMPLWESGETPEEIAAEFEMAARYGIQVLNFPMNSIKRVDAQKAKMIDDALRIVGESGIPVYVHCAHGKDRTGLFIALYRMKYQLWSADRAYAEMRRLGHLLVNMITTWPMDEYFFRYARKLARLRSPSNPIVSDDCYRNLAF